MVSRSVNGRSSVDRTDRVDRHLAEIDLRLDRFEKALDEAARSAREQKTGLESLASSQRDIVDKFQATLLEIKTSSERRADEQERRWKADRDEQEARWAATLKTQSDAALQALSDQAVKFFGQKILSWALTTVGGTILLGLAWLYSHFKM